MLRLKIEIGALVIVLIGYLALIIWLSTYQCFEPNPTVIYDACNVDYLGAKAWNIITLKSP